VEGVDDCGGNGVGRGIDDCGNDDVNGEDGDCGRCRDGVCVSGEDVGACVFFFFDFVFPFALFFLATLRVFLPTVDICTGRPIGLMPGAREFKV
jgi:hypothetical protein